MKRHIAIFKNGDEELILSGKKTVEVRFSKNKAVPFGQVSSGDLVYIKPVGKDIIGEFRVKKVLSFDGLDEVDLKEIKDRFGQDATDAKYATVIFISESSRFITSPIKVTKKDNRGWLVLE